MLTRQASFSRAPSVARSRSWSCFCRSSMARRAGSMLAKKKEVETGKGNYEFGPCRFAFCKASLRHSQNRPHHHPLVVDNRITAQVVFSCISREVNSEMFLIVLSAPICLNTAPIHTHAQSETLIYKRPFLQTFQVMYRRLKGETPINKQEP